MNIKITEEEKCISLLCSLPKYWDNLVVAIGTDNTTLNIDDVLATLLLERNEEIDYGGIESLGTISKRLICQQKER